MTISQKIEDCAILILNFRKIGIHAYKRSPMTIPGWVIEQMWHLLSRWYYRGTRQRSSIWQINRSANNMPRGAAPLYMLHRVLQGTALMRAEVSSRLSKAQARYKSNSDENVRQGTTLNVGDYVFIDRTKSPLLCQMHLMKWRITNAIICTRQSPGP